ncbi:hypothetical protein M0R88_09765 [Halorussus gelatinilyticus]|uniref:DUF3054 domain-containing protein n=1 Tax=Halorussus gelatinilyticus TaxID=2937524 RepID=A0A8U0IFI5_9EURY|nr:hypothetical protein [Halorussus gelatinilyticus]UPV98818.1 hypothetical protein M0R88_09765 [Halorussus gelatinilyticus]
MDWSRLGQAFVDASFVGVPLGAVLSPPDPFTQLRYIGTAFAVVLPVAYRYDPRILWQRWQDHLLFVVGIAALQIGWHNVVSGTRWPLLGFVVLFGGSGVIVWLAYFGGLARLLGEHDEDREASEA